MAKILDFKANNTTIGSGASGLTNVVGPDWNVVRNSIATYKDNLNVITEVASNVPRIQDSKVLIELQDTNNIGFNEDMSVGSWTKSRAAVASSSDTAPNGTGVFQTITCTTTSINGYSVGRQYTPGAVEHKFLGFYILKGGGWINISASNTGNLASKYFDTTNGVLGSDSVLGLNFDLLDSGIIDFSSTAYFCWIEFRDNVGTEFNAYKVAGSDADGNHDVTIGRVFSAWGGVMTAYHPSSYIYNVDSTFKTREADVITNTVPVGTAPITMTTWIDGVSDGGVVVNQGDPITMVNGTTSIEIEDSASTTTVEVEWIDSISAAATGNKIYRDDVEIADIGMGVQIYQDDTAETGTTYKYEVQAYSATDETTQEVTDVNVKTITTAS